LLLSHVQQERFSRDEGDNSTWQAVRQAGATGGAESMKQILT